jgi:Family of unknown function (DUF6508)
VAENREDLGDTFEGVLRGVSSDQWDEIWSALDEVIVDPEPIRWEGGGPAGTTTINGVEHPVTSLAYPVYSAAVERLRAALGVLVVPFAWPEWDGVRRYRGGRGMAGAPAADAVRMITAVLRSERFSDGSIAGAIADDSLPAAVRRLRVWHGQNVR